MTGECVCVWGGTLHDPHPACGLAPLSALTLAPPKPDLVSPAALSQVEGDGDDLPASRGQHGRSPSTSAGQCVWAPLAFVSK